MTDKLITIFGGTGFLGLVLAQRLLEAGYRVQLVSRHPAVAEFLKPLGPVGKLVLTQLDLHHVAHVHSVVKGSFAVINLLGVLYEKGGQSFSQLHVEAAEAIAKSATKQGVKHMMHVSALALEEAASVSQYAASKVAGEKRVRMHFPCATIVRPSIMFGPGDHFYNQFAAMTRWSPFLPLIGGGKTRFQPVYVGDVVEAMLRVLKQDSWDGAVLELGGPQVFSFKEIMTSIMQMTGRRRFLLPIPFILARPMAAIMERFAKPLLTRDQLAILKVDNILHPHSQATRLSDLGITAKTVQEIVPTYLK